MRYFLVLLGVVALAHAVKAQRNDFSDVDFRNADSVARLYAGHNLNHIETLAAKLTTPFSTDIEKFRAIYTWVCTNIANDFELYEENKQKRDKITDPKELSEWNAKFTPRVFQQLIRNKKTVCTGYSSLVRELALLSGLNCASIDGYGRTAQSNVGGRAIANHSWNAIQLNAKWYLCDATWSSGSIDPATRSFMAQFDDSYFLADPELFVRSHYPLDSTWTLLKHNPKLDDFLNGPLIYRGAFQQNLNSFSPEVFSISCKKGDTVSFRLGRNDDQIFKKAELLVWKGNSSVVYRLKPERDGELYVLNHVFKNKGVFTVHIVLDSVMVVTYAVKVE